jgi:RNA polymerase sigma-70 factor (ECF subfamily)
MRERLRTALAALPDRQRIAVTLFDSEGWTHAEIAELVGAPVGTVRSEVFHGRRTLREALAGYREELR